MSEFESISSNQQTEQKGLDLGRALGVGGPEIKEVVKAENFKATVIVIKFFNIFTPMHYIGVFYVAQGICSFIRSQYLDF